MRYLRLINIEMGTQELNKQKPRSGSDSTENK